MSIDDFTARIAVYDDPGRPPEVISLEAADATALIRSLGEAVERLLIAHSTRLPGLAVREVIDNVIHARCADPVVTILDGGQTLLVSDRGPGIPDKEAALLPGFTTAGAAERRTVRGVGAGLAIAREALSTVSGSLEISDNLGGGTVVRLHAPPAPAPSPQPAIGAGPKLPDRQLRALLLLLELGPVGPTKLARELDVAASTAYRDLLNLHELGLVSVDASGHRHVTEAGLSHIESVL